MLLRERGTAPLNCYGLWGTPQPSPSDLISVTVTRLENLSKAHPQTEKKIERKSIQRTVISKKIGVSPSVLLMLHGMLMGSSESEEC